MWDKRKKREKKPQTHSKICYKKRLNFFKFIFIPGSIMGAVPFFSLDPFYLTPASAPGLHRTMIKISDKYSDNYLRWSQHGIWKQTKEM